MELELSPELARLQPQLEKYARDFGLDFWETRFVMLDYEMVNQVAAYDGFPSRYPHWRFGMEYNQLSRSYAYGLHRIYEMVINNDPAYAYLLASNKPVDQKMVMLHVFGHVDFFKNNFWFAHTNRKMLDEMANHATRIARHIEKQGLERVEEFLDACLSIDNLIDMHAAGIRRRPVVDDEQDCSQVSRIPSKDYMDKFINPPEYMESQRRAIETERERLRGFPEVPERDVMLFLLEHAPLENWERDILDIIREEAYYFVPQRQTKILNEGWAVYSHTHLMTEYAMTPDELIDYADHHSGVVAMGGGKINPYKIGFELFRDIEDRWNRGAFGQEYDQCDDMRERENWDKKLGLGRQKVFDVRKVYNDLGFLDEFLTEEFVNRHKLFTYNYSDAYKVYYISSRDFKEIKNRLLFRLTNGGSPIIELKDANYGNKGELFLVHRHEGHDLDIPFAEETLNALHRIWKRPVCIETKVGDDNKFLTWKSKS